MKESNSNPLGERQMGIYQGLSECKPDAQGSASILAYTRLRFGLVLVRNYLPLALSSSFDSNWQAFCVGRVLWVGKHGQQYQYPAKKLT